MRPKLKNIKIIDREIILSEESQNDVTSVNYSSKISLVKHKDQTRIKIETKKQNDVNKKVLKPRRIRK